MDQEEDDKEDISIAGECSVVWVVDFPISAVINRDCGNMRPGRTVVCSTALLGGC